VTVEGGGGGDGDGDGEVAGAVCAALERFGADALYYEQETAAAARARDRAVCAAVRAAGGAVTSVSGHTLYDPRLLVRACGGSAPATMAALQGAMARVGEPMLPLPDVGPLPAPPEGAADGVPPLEAFGVAGGEEALEGGGFVARYEGGEDQGLARFDAFLARGGGKEAAVFEKPNTSPAAWRDGEQETTVLSPHLALGTVGVRAVYHAVRAVQREHSAGGGAVSQPPVSLIGQLMFRELFHACAATVPGFEGMAGNAMCRQVAWGAGEEDAERWRRWERAETGFPWIDALMTQLRTEGFVHHLGRHSLACFLTRGDLWVSWERGAETFEKYLVDWDEALSTLLPAGAPLRLAALVLPHCVRPNLCAPRFPSSALPPTVRRCRELDVALCVGLLPPVSPCLLARRVRQALEPGAGVHPALPSRPRARPRRVHL
jgi:cryptochrome